MIGIITRYRKRNTQVRSITKLVDIMVRVNRCKMVMGGPHDERSARMVN